MRLRLTKIDEYQFLTCMKYSLWGSRSARFKDWHDGDYLTFIVDKTLAGLAEIAGKPFQSQEGVWDNGVFPYRISIKFVHVLSKEQRVPLLGEVRDALTSAWGTRYGWGILNQQVLQDEKADTIILAIRSRQNSLPEYVANLEQLIQEAKRERENVLMRIKRKKPSSEREIALPPEEFETKEEESIHSKAQDALIKLGKITGCSVWIAPNDRNRLFRGKALGDECLKEFPNLGLNEEAMRRISLIDVIWIRQNNPVCAFEVETTTSIYSGLLRMSDLISVVPALNVKLYIVAPKARQDRVEAELTRPTFQKVGLNDYCRFIATEKLYDLLAKIESFEGHIQPTILDKIAVGFEEKIENLMQYGVSTFVDMNIPS